MLHVECFWNGIIFSVETEKCFTVVKLFNSSNYFCQQFYYLLSYSVVHSHTKLPVKASTGFLCLGTSLTWVFLCCILKWWFLPSELHHLIHEYHSNTTSAIFLTTTSLWPSCQPLLSNCHYFMRNCIISTMRSSW